MKNFKRILSITLGGIILAGTTAFGTTGTVNAPNGLVLRETASKSANPIMTVSDNSEVEILEKNDEWYKVKYNSYEGYLFAEYVEVSEEIEKPEEVVEESTEEQENNQEETVIEEPEINSEQPKNIAAKSDLKIYTIPSVTANVLLTVKTGEEIIINYELNNWVNITYGNKTGWARKYFVNNENQVVEENTETTQQQPQEEVEKPEVEQEEKELIITVIDNKKGYVDVSSSANIREKASTDSNIVERLLRNTEVIITAEEGDFYKIKYQDITGYISKSLISDKPVGETTSRGNGEEREVSEEKEVVKEEVVEEKETTEIKNETEKTEETVISPVVSDTSKGNDIATYAKKYIGYNYVSGGTTPSNGFDCSGFVYYVVNSCGYSLSRSCQIQAKSGIEVARENLVPGDLIFFCNGGNGSIGHVGIYIGGGQIVHAANSRRGVTTDTINSGYYDKYYFSARRIAE